MKTIKITALASTTVLAIALGCAGDRLATTGNFADNTPASLTIDGSPQTGGSKVCFNLPKATLEKVFTASGGSEVVTEIYPILGPTGTAKALGVRFVFRAPDGKKLHEFSSIKKAKYKKSATRYARFLKERNVPKDKAMIGYQMQLHKNSLDGSGDNELCVSLENPEPTYQFMMAKSVYDSCKIPPGCHGLSLLDGPSVQSILDETYGDDPE